MSTNADRMWSIRDAILLWLYEEQAGARKPNIISSERLQTAVGWVPEPITRDELLRDIEYLRSDGYIDGTGTSEGDLLYPSILPKGEHLVAKEVSVRPGPERPAEPTGPTTHNWTFNNSGPTQMAINSGNFTQNMTVAAKRERINEVADTLDRYADEGLDNAGQARALAQQIREANAAPEENAGALRTLLASAIGAVAGAAGTEIGQQVMQLVTNALPLLPA